jgi:proteasome lid subunit RPN8/RPN11
MKITKEIIDSVFKHAEKEAPMEACGYLVGIDDIIKKHIVMTNIDKSEEHFSFDPKEQFSTLKTLRAEGLKIIAIYHSHPATPARPSKEDIQLAYDPSVSYVIASLKDNQKDIKSFKIRDSEIIPEPLEIM